MTQYDMWDMVEYDDLLQIHEDYLLKQAALETLEWEWVSDHFSEWELNDNLIRRLYNG